MPSWNRDITGTWLWWKYPEEIHSAPVLGWVSSETELRQLLSTRVLFGRYLQDTPGVEWGGKMGKSLSKGMYSLPHGCMWQTSVYRGAPTQQCTNSQDVSNAVVRGGDLGGNSHICISHLVLLCTHSPGKTRHCSNHLLDKAATLHHPHNG